MTATYPKATTQPGATIPAGALMAGLLLAIALVVGAGVLLVRPTADSPATVGTQFVPQPGAADRESRVQTAPAAAPTDVSLGARDDAAAVARQRALAAEQARWDAMAKSYGTTTEAEARDFFDRYGGGYVFGGQEPAPADPLDRIAGGHR